MAKWASASMIPTQSIWSTIIINSARDQIRMCQCKTSLASTIKICNNNRAHSSMLMQNPLLKHNIIQQTKVTATHMVVANSMCRVHLCSSISHLKGHSSSCRIPSRSPHSIFLAHQDRHTSSHGAKNWTRRTCTSSTSNRKNYLTSISTGTRSSCLPTSASKQRRTLVKMEAYSLHNQYSAFQWAPRRANSRSWTSLSLRRRAKLENQNGNHIRTSKFLSKRESLSTSQWTPEQETATLKIKWPKHLVRKLNPSSKWAHPLALASKMPRPNHRCSWPTD